MNDDFTIDRRSGVSAWKQIADRIGRAIQSGEYDATGMVPPETVLAERFGVNRHTVRSAIASLAENGVLKRVQGRGTIIEKRERLVYPVGRRTRFSDGLGNQASDLDTQLLSSETIEPPPAVASALRLDPGAVVTRLDTLGSAGGEPLSLASHYFDSARFPDIARELGQRHSITQALAAQGVEDYVRVSTEITGRLATAAECSRLRLSSSAVVLETVAINADSAGRPIQFSRTIFAADRITIRLDTQSG